MDFTIIGNNLASITCSLYFSTYAQIEAIANNELYNNLMIDF